MILCGIGAATAADDPIRGISPVAPPAVTALPTRDRASAGPEAAPPPLGRMPRIAAAAARPAVRRDPVALPPRPDADARSPSIFEDDEAWERFEVAAPASRRVEPSGWAPDHGRAGLSATPATAPDDPLADPPVKPSADAPATPLPLRPAAAERPVRGVAAAPAAGLDRLGGGDPEPDKAVLPPPGSSADPLDHAAAAAPAQPLEALPPLNAAMKKALDARDAAEIRGTGAGERRKERAAIAFFYAAHGFAPIWSKDGRSVEAVSSVLDTLLHAGDDALTLPTTPSTLAAAGSPDEIAASELALTEAVIAYARQATGSRINPRDISPLIGESPALADPGEVLDHLAAAGREAGTNLRALNPGEPRYAALRDKLNEMRAARSGGGLTLPAGSTLRIGSRDRRVPLLRAHFHLDAPAGGDDLRFDSALASAVAGFQRSNDLPATGSLTAATTLALGGGGSSRAEGLLIANMEMWRWMPRDLGADRIEVNVPDYLVTVFRKDQAIDQHRVVVGKTDTPTPLFSNTMKYLIVNPYWNVPQSIIKKEMQPKYGDLSYLDGRGYSVGWRGGQVIVRQLPGPKNALGRIKFLFPNDYSVYLHDTPSKALFSSAKRAFSHGCVRVDQPFGFAETVLNAALPEGARKVWSEERLSGLIGDKERYINLPTPLPIHIAYFTASVEDGRIRQRQDIYGYARAVALALGQAADPAPTAERKPRVVADRSADRWVERSRRRAVRETAVDDGLDPQ